MTSVISHPGDPRPARGPWRQRAAWAVAGLVVLAAAALAYWQWPRPEPPPVACAHHDPDDEDAPRPDPGYLGPQVCAECHKDRYAEFAKGRHPQACVEPKAETMPRGFAPGRGSHQTYLPEVR